MRTRAAAAALAALPLGLADGVLAELVREGASAHRAAMGAVGRALAEPGLLSYDFTAGLYAEAARRGFLEVQVLLVQPPALRRVLSRAVTAIPTCSRASPRTESHRSCASCSRTRGSPSGW